jgi:cytochrome c oxidase assembly protein subunit 11
MTSQDDLVRKNAQTGLWVMGIVFFMIGLSFASVPLYRIFCQVTGFGGTTQTGEQFPAQILDRKITVQFNADIGQDLQWTFTPEQRQITVQIGQKGVTAFSAHNLLSTPVTAMALYNVTPLKAGKYFHKVQCFCFNEQTLNGNQQVSMPVLFYIDPALDQDPNMKDVDVITLSYTFYQSDTKTLDAALDAFYNESQDAPASPTLKP